MFEMYFNKTRDSGQYYVGFRKKGPSLFTRACEDVKLVPLSTTGDCEIQLTNKQIPKYLRLGVKHLSLHTVSLSVLKYCIFLHL